MTNRSRTWLAGALAGVTVAWASSVAAADLQVNVTANGSSAAPVPPLSTTVATQIVAGQMITVACDTTSDCTSVKVAEEDRGVSTPLTGTKPTKAEATFALEPNLVTSANAQLQILYNDHKLVAFALSAAPSAGQARSSGQGIAATAIKSLAELLGTVCPAKAFNVQPYDRVHDTAEVVVTPRGSPITPLSSSFDENDELRVTVYGDARLMPLLKVARKSGFRAVGGINILGVNVAVPPSLLVQAEGLTTDASCTAATFILRDFAPGKGEVELTVMSGNDAVTIGGFEFAVHPLYTGMFSLGGLWTPLMAPSFSVVTQGGQTVVTQGEQGSRRFGYVFLYTPFLWAPRDIEKGPERWYHHINPSVGFVLNHPLDNAVLGVTWDFAASVLVTGGVIFSHIETLQGLSAGDQFSGTSSDLPIGHTWDHDWFIAVSVDLRAAVALLRAVVTSPSTPAGS